MGGQASPEPLLEAQSNGIKPRSGKSPINQEILPTDSSVQIQESTLPASGTPEPSRQESCRPRPPPCEPNSPKSRTRTGASQHEASIDDAYLHESDDEDYQAPMVPGVRKCNWEQFINRFSKYEPLYAVDVLEAGEDLGNEIQEENKQRKTHPIFEGIFIQTQTQVKRRRYDNTKWPQMIRVRSPRLLAIFSRVTGYAWAAQPYTFRRPFQYLIYFHGKLKEELERMEVMTSRDSEHVGQSISSSSAPNTAFSLQASILTQEGTSQILEESPTAAREDGSGRTALVPQGGSEYLAALEDLRSYIQFAEAEIMPGYRRFQGVTYSSSLRIRFDELWYLFRPGELLYMPSKTLAKQVANYAGDMLLFDSSDESSMQQKIWRVFFGLNPRTRQSNELFYVSCYYIDYDGTNYGAVSEYFGIEPFQGEKDIRDLELYPLRFAPGADALLEEYRKTGTKFTNSISAWHMSHNGWTLITDPIGRPIRDYSARIFDRRQRRPAHLEGEVIVDFKEAFNSNPEFMSKFTEDVPLASQRNTGTTEHNWEPLAIWSGRDRTQLIATEHDVIVINDDISSLEHDAFLETDPYLKHDKTPNFIPEGDDLVLLPRRLFVYSLREGKFAPVDIRCMRTIERAADGLSRLQLQDDHKRIIQAAVRSHLKRRSVEKRIEEQANAVVRTQDFIRGKGRGLVVMLHGEPGIGKTATAEAIAQSEKRPLFSISGSSLSLPYIDAEDTLDQYFRLADLWNCILLLDEADVFLSARMPTEDMHRNNLVSGQFCVIPPAFPTRPMPSSSSRF
jgi:hypothetical protein